MNVIIANKYREELATLDIEIIKSLTGEFTVDEIVDTFKNFFFQRMILDVTALKNYQDIKTLQKLSLSLDMDRVILLLENTPAVTNPEYLSDLISMRIYNFTMNVEGVKYLYDNPNSYRDVAQYHQLDTNHNYGENTIIKFSDKAGHVVLGVKNITEQSGATCLIYSMKKQLERNYAVTAIEVDKHDFMYLDDKTLVSTSSAEIGNTLAKYSSSEVVLIDINKSKSAESLVSDILYLVEPSKIKINKLLARNPRAFENYKDKKIILNQSLLSNRDVLDFEYETNTKTFYNLPPLNDQENNNPALDNLLVSLGFVKQGSSEEVEKKKGLFGIFK